MGEVQQLLVCHLRQVSTNYIMHTHNAMRTHTTLYMAPHNQYHYYMVLYMYNILLKKELLYPLHNMKVTDYMMKQKGNEVHVYIK